MIQEIKILKEMNHKYIIRFKDVYRTANGKICIVMEYAGGGDLMSCIDKAKISGEYFEENLILDWFTQI